MNNAALMRRFNLSIASRGLKLAVLVMALGLPLGLTGCVTQRIGPDGAVLAPPEDDRLRGDGSLAVQDGLIVCAPVAIAGPTTIRINKEKTRTVTFLGVEGADRNNQTQLWEDGVSYLLGLFKQHPIVYIRPEAGVDLNATSFKGSVLVPDKTGEGYFDVTQGMLGEGLLRVTDERQFQTDIIAERAKAREAEAKKNRKGLWSAKAAQPKR